MQHLLLAPVDSSLRNRGSIIVSPYGAIDEGEKS